MDKIQLRQLYLSKRSAICEQTRKSAQRHLMQRVMKQAERWPEGSVIGGYVAMRDELDIAPLLADLRRRGFTIALPVIANRNAPLQFHPWEPTAPLVHGPFNTLQPEASTPMVPVILFVPLLAFDRTGHRLGYGGGYYDRTLHLLKSASPLLQCIGVAFSVQEAQNLPPEPHDQKLDAVVTENEWIEIGC